MLESPWFFGVLGIVFGILFEFMFGFARKVVGWFRDRHDTPPPAP